ncbi:sugar ABC transporter permease, partial [Rhodococcus sp. NPDC057014]|uniref:ABC transporter permease subunit n=1 Tax=Rhodococcus sp. NPDC057014 TaxID=3346000 RepID=UPI003639B63D
LIIYFSSQSEFFLSSRNISNLLVQTVVTGTIALGLVFILLTGEIDLSVAAISGVTSVLMAKLVVAAGFNSIVAVIVAVVLGALIGALTGLWSTRFLVPSFVVTLGVGLVLNGFQLMLLPTSGQYNLLGTGIDKIAGTYVTGVFSWLTVVVAVAVVLGLRLTSYRRKIAHEITASLVREVVIPTVVTAVAGVVIVAVLDANEGVPMPVVIFAALLAVAAYTLNESRFGLHLYAAGGNAEAANRAGINVRRLKVLTFTIAGTLAAVAGIISASRILGVSVSSGGGIGGGALLLNAIAAAVIGGVSLFGGRGKASAALLGALVIGVVGNGLNLLGVSTNVQLIVTGLLLIVAVTVDRSIERITGPTK